MLRELHRRCVWRTLGVFTGGGCGIFQVVDRFNARGFIPEWVFAGALGVGSMRNLIAQRALEVARPQGYVAVLDGEVASSGSEYLTIATVRST